MKKVFLGQPQREKQEERTHPRRNNLRSRNSEAVFNGVSSACQAVSGRCRRRLVFYKKKEKICDYPSNPRDPCSISVLFTLIFYILSKSILLLLFISSSTGLFLFPVLLMILSISVFSILYLLKRGIFNCSIHSLIFLTRSLQQYSTF